MGVFDPALTILQGIPDNAGVDPLERVRLEAMAYAKKNNFAQADKLLTEGQARYPKAGNFSGVRAEFYRLMGYSALYETNSGAAGEKVAAGWFQKSLDALDEELNWTLTSSESTTHELEIPRINRDKTEMQMALKDYSNAIITATAMLHQQPANLQPLLNRAICELLLGRLDDAKNDYLALEKSPEPSYIVYWGLAQIAQKRNDKKSEIHYDNLYLKNAPTNALEYAEIARQLHKLEEGH
jgi:tetratricopeptide (TPR) repeat protein